ncbi:DUF3416 domain-containing protein [Komagataeibacter sp. FXV2]|nr:DUF3416 domain-containing protein [Komagataeibacter sp. FXV2]
MVSGNPQPHVHTSDDDLPSSSPVIRYLPPAAIGRPEGWARLLARAAASGFTDLLVAPLFAATGDPFLVSSHSEGSADLSWDVPFATGLRQLCAAARKHGIAILLDLPLDRMARDGTLARQHPTWCLPDHDPRAARWDFAGHSQEIHRYWATVLHSLLEAGVAGFRCDAPWDVPPEMLRDIIRSSHAITPACRWIAWTAGLPPDMVRQVALSGVNMVSSSLAWWNRRDPWFEAEWAPLPPGVGRLACPLPLPGGSAPLPPGDQVVMNLRLCGATGDGLLVSADDDDGQDIRVRNAIIAAGRMIAMRRGKPLPRPMRLTSADAPVTVLAFHAERYTRLVLANASLGQEAFLPLATLPLDPAAFGPIDGDIAVAHQIRKGRLGLRAGEVRVLEGARQHAPVMTHPSPDARTAARHSRIVIENVTPAITPSRFSAKAEIDTPVMVEADIFMDGHDLLAARLCWRAMDTACWRHERMEMIGNGRWRGFMYPDRIGPWEYTITAWVDSYASVARALEKKQAAGRVSAQDVEDARLLIHAAATDAHDTERQQCLHLAQILPDLPQEEALRLLLSPQVRTLMAHVARRPFLTQLPAPVPIFVDRRAARYGSWYELFPRSQSPVPHQHGTLRDVIARLPHIRDMGFDVLYFPPIHPIGRLNRKGRNNALHADADDVGSPYAIGSDEGGHDSIHPQLGTFSDFRDLNQAARAHGLELAMDFAIQCAPDHPWVTQHPQWFDHRADGSIRHAENPPKTYEDIVNVDFYAEGAIPSLWLTLRDIVLLWIGEGVRIFRVDNPHTKPLPFWEWMIADIHALYPETIFLAEAFTHPGMMYRLAKAGFTQSYTYFTWRNGKEDLMSYMTEITSAPVCDFFRPHFFVNTPDINPFFVQDSTRAAHLIRVTLATTLSGLWGMYEGFERCEATPIPGREEYMDSEKYQIRKRDIQHGPDIIAEITMLNAIRRDHPCLQTHRGVRFYNMFNDAIIYFAKGMTNMSDVVLVAISLDPAAVQEADFEVPLWEWGLADNASIRVHDLVHDRHGTWHGKIQHIRLDPHDLPFAIWHVRPVEGHEA